MKAKPMEKKNAAYQKIAALKTNRTKRFSYSQFFVEGVRNINEAIANQWHICSFLYAPDRPLSVWAHETLSSVKTDGNYELSLSLMEELSDKEETSELLAVVKMRKGDASPFFLSPNPLVCLFDRPSSPGNLGTLIRSCDSFGVNGLILTGHGVDLYEPEVIRASMGSFFKVPVLSLATNGEVLSFFEKMKKDYPLFQVLGTTAKKERPLFQLDFTLPTLVMLGNETKGLSTALKDHSDHLVSIPMSPCSKATSLNVSCAGTVFFYEALRQRQEIAVQEEKTEKNG